MAFYYLYLSTKHLFITIHFKTHLTEPGAAWQPCPHDGESTMQLYIVAASGDSNLVLVILQKQLKLLVEVKRAIPSRVALTPYELSELFLQAHYILQGCSGYCVGQTCLFCYTDCSRFYYFRLPTLKTSLHWLCNCTSCDPLLCNATDLPRKGFGWDYWSSGW